MQCGRSVQLLNVKLVVYHVTSRLRKVNTNRRFEHSCVRFDMNIAEVGVRADCM